MDRKKRRRVGLDCLGVPALLQLQAQGINVSRQLMAKGHTGLISPNLPYLPPQETNVPERRGKFNVAPVEDRTKDGIRFDSKIEMLVYQALRHYQVRFERQPSYVLQEAFVDAEGKQHREIRYVGDFLIHGPDQDYLVDVKGVKTQLFRLKEKMLLKTKGIKIHCFRKVNEVLLFLAERQLIGTGKNYERLE